jgi:hypothetical protein
LKERKTQETECTAIDQQDCPVPLYTRCGPGETSCGGRRLKKDLTAEERVEHLRKLQFGGLVIPDAGQFEIKDDETPLPYDQPCHSPTRTEMKNSWTVWDANDDVSVKVELKFNFDFFGRTYTEAYIADNGFLSFENTFQNNYQPSSFPSGLDTPIIAPFWADTEVARNGGRGNIYYKDFGDHLAVIYDEVGYYTGSTNIAPTHNSYQMVLSQTPTADSPNNRNPELNNICFCYLDMGWTHGERDGTDGFEDARDGKDQTRSATVGITAGYPSPYQNTQYAQIGRFNETGNTHRGVLIPSGIDFLDFLGSTKKKNGQSARAGFCFNSRPNIPPIFKAGPTDGLITIPCKGNLEEYKVYFGTPEIYQAVSLKQIVEQPEIYPDGLSVVIDGVGDSTKLIPDDTLGIRFEWLAPDFDKYGGQTFTWTFEVCDNHASNPLCITESISIILAQCGDDDCTPEMCTPLTDSTCFADVGPSCIPWRSPEQCDPLYSFPMLVSSRYNFIKESLHGETDDLADNDWWFHYTDDRAGAYAFTNDAGYPAPEVQCCVETVNELLGTAAEPSTTSLCFNGQVDSPNWTDSFVIRAEGHHSGTGVFVLPSGLDTTGGETTVLGLGEGTISLAQVRAYLAALTPTPKKILIEKFIPGSGTGETATLPNEYKFHMFNGAIGSISTFMNPGTDCKCYGEFSEDWDCLHKHGCFEPKFPLAVKDEQDPTCYAVDFDAGAKKPYPVKGYDFCGSVPKPSGCVFDTMKAIAKDLSAKIGVYVRIDMFATDAGEIYVQEYTFNHLGGTRHCVSQETDSGCIDSCILGKLWQAAGGSDTEAQEMGGPKTPLPATFAPTSDGTKYGEMSNTVQCSIAVTSGKAYTQTCVGP